MTVAELLARARAQVGHHARSMAEQENERAIYQMGGGSLDLDALHPWGNAADGPLCCSAFATWCMRVRKLQPDGHWLNTDRIWTMAKTYAGGLFVKLERPEVGCLLVYPSAHAAQQPGPTVGHVGIVTELAEDGSASKAIHCSSGNFRRTGDAIGETYAGVFSNVKATIACWCTTIEQGQPHPAAATCMA